MSPSRPGAPAHGLAALPRGSRPALGTAQIAGICLFPVLGAALVAVFGLRVGNTLLLLGGCGVIGAVTMTVTAAGGTRRFLGALAAAAADPGAGGNAQGPGDTAASR
jgi:nitrate reductase NapE component